MMPIQHPVPQLLDEARIVGALLAFALIIGSQLWAKWQGRRRR